MAVEGAVCAGVRQRRPRVGVERGAVAHCGGAEVVGGVCGAVAVGAGPCPAYLGEGGEGGVAAAVG
ncbi:MAG: hypothetical protein OXD31_10545, partial [Chloroflexi bacterium]|nr:hypothetical protein [Chloroflexota bacterium]